MPRRCPTRRTTNGVRPIGRDKMTHSQDESIDLAQPCDDSADLVRGIAEAVAADPAWYGAELPAAIDAIITHHRNRGNHFAALTYSRAKVAIHPGADVAAILTRACRAVYRD
jgi:hypothetical protein